MHPQLRARSSVGSEHLVYTQGVRGSNPFAPTDKSKSLARSARLFYIQNPQARLEVLGIKKASYSLRDIRLLLFQDVPPGISNPFSHHPNIIPNKLGGFLKHKKCDSFAWQMKAFVISTWGATGYPIPSISLSVNRFPLIQFPLSFFVKGIISTLLAAGQ